MRVCVRRCVCRGGAWCVCVRDCVVGCVGVGGRVGVGGGRGGITATPNVPLLPGRVLSENESPESTPVSRPSVHEVISVVSRNPLAQHITFVFTLQ